MWMQLGTRDYVEFGCGLVVAVLAIILVGMGLGWLVWGR